ncbi:Ankyrin (modular protein) [Candidatus Promineifilum breve]|uniref:Ankyrin (Modular protein) n=1 Tax=Candidatus Promineifilum breve TaxID=1806508 RepID=A0A1A9C6Z1_9CHLR|nr:ankyrin repeat domain-containing protein [Candidatus Promineifilum breve]SBU01532.1 Ankyrin (modular protein) [Candidatus Promineifilum breve]
MTQPAPGDLSAAVAYLAEATQHFSDADLGQPYRWGAHQEGVRFALLGAMHELRTLAVELAAERRRLGQPPTRAQHALAQYHAAYHDLNAVLLGVSAEEYEQPPAPGEWPLRYVYGHMVGAERNFFALVHYGLWRQRDGGSRSATLPEDEANRLLGPYATFGTLMESGDREALAAYHAIQHDRALAEFATISDAEIDGPSVWWEGEPYTLEYRLHRMEAHLRQHTVQVQKSRDQLARPATEARRLLRLVYGALAEAEGVLIGAPDLAAAERDTAAVSIRQLADSAVAAVTQANALVAAVTAGDRERVRELLAEEPRLANAISRDGVPIIRLATYYGQEVIAGMLGDTEGIALEIWDGAALGRADVVEANHKGWGDFILNEYSRDGYSPLQLACFFGREEVARYLIEKGANVNAVSLNAMAVQPLHSAVAGDHTAVVALLLAAGADANAAQQDGFRPLHAAAQNGNAEIARLLLAHGGDPALTDDQGRPPRELAEEKGAADVAALL